MPEKFTLGKVFSAKGWYQFIGFFARVALIVVFALAGYAAYSFIKPKQSIQQNQPRITAKDNAKVVNNYIQNEKTGNWEVGAHGGAIRLGDQNGGYAGLEVKRRF